MHRLSTFLCCNIVGFQYSDNQIFAALFDLLKFVFLLRNIPHVHLHEKRENKNEWHGAEIQVIIEGNWTTYRVSCLLVSIVFILGF